MIIETLQLLTLVIGTSLAITGFFSSIEQRKDQAFSEASAQLCSKDPTMRAFAASQLPYFFFHRRLFLFWLRPYRSQVIDLILNALKKEDEIRFVRQAAFDALTRVTRAQKLHHLMEELRPELYGPRNSGLRREVDMSDSNLDQLVMHGFHFDHIDLSNSSIKESDLDYSTFVGARLYRANFFKSRLKHTDFSNAMTWRCSFDKTNLKNARFKAPLFDEHTSFKSANLREARIGKSLWEHCQEQTDDSNKEGVEIIPERPTPDDT